MCPAFIQRPFTNISPEKKECLKSMLFGLKVSTATTAAGVGLYAAGLSPWTIVPLLAGASLSYAERADRASKLSRAEQLEFGASIVVLAGMASTLLYAGAISYFIATTAIPKNFEKPGDVISVNGTVPANFRFAGIIETTMVDGPKKVVRIIEAEHQVFSPLLRNSTWTHKKRHDVPQP